MTSFPFYLSCLFSFSISKADFIKHFTTNVRQYDSGTYLSRTKVSTVLRRSVCYRKVFFWELFIIHSVVWLCWPLNLHYDCKRRTNEKSGPPLFPFPFHKQIVSMKTVLSATMTEGLHYDWNCSEFEHLIVNSHFSHNPLIMWFNTFFSKYLFFKCHYTPSIKYLQIIFIHSLSNTDQSTSRAI